MIQPLSKMKQTVTNILHNFNHKGVCEQDEKKNEQTTIVKKIQVKKRKKVVAR